jgi:hypothetical protein
MTPELTEPIPSATLQQNRWRHRVAFTANLYLDVETDSSDTPDRELERLAIEAVRRASSAPSGLPLDEIGIDIASLLHGRLYPETSLEDGLENFSIENCYPLTGK